MLNTLVLDIYFDRAGKGLAVCPAQRASGRVEERHRDQSFMGTSH